MNAIFESSAWIEYFSASPKGERVRDVVEGVGARYTPGVCLMEIKAKYLRECRDPTQRLDFICNSYCPAPPFFHLAGLSLNLLQAPQNQTLRSLTNDISPLQ